MSKLLNKSVFVVGVTILPMLAFAQTSETVDSILIRIQDIMGVAIPIIMTLALLYFFWGLAQYILGGSVDEEKRAAGRNIMIYGIIALFVMAAVWGLVRVLGNTFNVKTGGSVPELPQIPRYSL